ncbi:MAG: hypothetical protein WCD81_06200 [Candidatus Bathyarchaeia archaeon]
MEAPNNWKGLIEEATKYEAKVLTKATSPETEAKEERKVEAIVK